MFMLASDKDKGGARLPSHQTTPIHSLSNLSDRPRSGFVISRSNKRRFASLLLTNRNRFNPLSSFTRDSTGHEDNVEVGLPPRALALQRRPARFNFLTPRFNANTRGYQSGNRGPSGNFSRRDQRNRGSNENFSLGARRQGGRLNVLRARDDQNDQLQSATDVTIKLFAICMPPVELPYVPILLNETFTKALWDTAGKIIYI
ncbi:hypothetical protein TNCV_190051 [Trichonephila clavipes]|nr:hypothetical protein TNCV_190051 [Trichonephila clavipes]